MAMSHEIKDPRKPPAPEAKEKPKRGRIVKPKKDKEKKDKVSKEKLDVVPIEKTTFRKELRLKVLEARDQVERSRWDLAERLFKVRDETVYNRWGYNNFEQYMRVEVRMTERTGNWLVDMYNTFVNELEIENEILDQLKALGWTKAACLARLKREKILNKGNILSWINKAKDMSVMDLNNKVRGTIQKKSGGDDQIEPMKNKTFRLAPDQLEIVENAIQMASVMLESEKPGHCISMVCQDFVATNMFQKRNDRSLMGQYLNKIGAILDAKIIAVDKETGKVIHNSKLLEKIKTK